MADQDQWFFGFRQTVPRPPGKWIACGPYHDYDKAMTARNNAKNWDCEVSPPFPAASKAAAQGKCDADMMY